MSSVHPNTPVLVGVGTAEQRFNDYREAAEPLQLMIDAVRAAAEDAGSLPILQELETIYVPRGRWRYKNPGGLIGRAVGATKAHSLLAHVGVLQQTLIGDACRRIAEGLISAAVVVGGEAGYRIVRSKVAGASIEDTRDASESNVVLRAEQPLLNEVELRAGLADAVGSYAIIESAYRAACGWSVDVHRDRLAKMYSNFSRIASSNPRAWRRALLEADTIRGPSPRNPMVSFPYTKLHMSSWSVDQAGALLLCSAVKAAALGIAPERWVLPMASTESNSMTYVSERSSIAEVPGADIAGRSALEVAGVHVDELDLLDLYSCFPVAVEVFARALGIRGDRTDLTVTGGMPFSGGPLNNYVLQATCRMAQLLRERPGSVGLVSSVSGLLTKQGFGVWTSAHSLRNPYQSVDVTAQVDHCVKRKRIVDGHVGVGVIAGYTVTHPPGKDARAIIVADVGQDGRAVAWSEDAALTAVMETGEEFVGRNIHLTRDQFRLG